MCTPLAKSVNYAKAPLTRKSSRKFTVPLAAPLVAALSLCFPRFFPAAFPFFHHSRVSRSKIWRRTVSVAARCLGIFERFPCYLAAHRPAELGETMFGGVVCSVRWNRTRSAGVQGCVSLLEGDSAGVSFVEEGSAGVSSFSVTVV